MVALFRSRVRWLAVLRKLQYGDSMNKVTREEFTLQDALAAVANSADGLYAILLKNGSMELGYYKPDSVDEQQPHDQDEIYIVQSGSGTFTRDDEQFPFSSGDALFVAAGVKHHFENFTHDFAAWVIFYGPPGGE